MEKDKPEFAIAGADCSSFVEHLRLVYFTLIAASLITIIAITSEAPSSAARAYEQTNLLLRVRDRWHSGEWLRAQSHATTGHKSGLPTRAVFELVVPANISPPSVFFVVDLTNSGRSRTRQ
jgi:hypothetical protein